MPDDRDFQRRGGLQAYLIALFSLAYAAVYLGPVRADPGNAGASALANALLAGAGLSATIAAVAVASRVGGAAGLWLGAVGVGWGLLSATHGAFGAIADWQGITVAPLSPTDPRGFATFAVAGLWTLTVGLQVRIAAGFPRNYALLAIVAGANSIVLFVATILGSGELVLVSGGLAAIILGPAFWIWTGRILRA